MIDKAVLWLKTEQETLKAGLSLAKTLYAIPLTVFVSGEVGAGKTTFIRGLARGLGVESPVVSPTFALEQRYATKTHEELLHLDLYRLRIDQAGSLVESTEDHAGIRCIEWPQRLTAEATTKPSIVVELEEWARRDTLGRKLTIHFLDLPLPSVERIRAWREDVMLPAHIRRHCDCVGIVAQQLSLMLLERSIVSRPLALRRAGEAHDLLRFLDFKDGASPEGMTPLPEEEICWSRWKQRFPDLSHEAAIDAFLKQEGFHDLGTIVRPHGLTMEVVERATTDQKLLFYADKRVRIDSVVSLDERFEDFRKRYSKGKMSPMADVWYEEARSIERELFPDGPPF